MISCSETIAAVHGLFPSTEFWRTKTLLDVSWASFAAGAIVFCALLRDERRQERISRLISAVFIIALLFPFISADDDLVQLDFIDDASTSQSIAVNIDNDKHPPVSPTAAALPAYLPEVPIARDFAIAIVLEPSIPDLVDSSNKTGNHSPPVSS